jgi:Mrp family chromosome partitioning ATPase
LQVGASNGHSPTKTVGVIGCDTTKSRSRVATVLAMQAACSGNESVLLIDADTRRRRVARRFRLNGAPGWCEILAGNATAKDCVHRSKLSNLAVLGPGGAAEDGCPKNSIDNALVQFGDVKAGFGLIVVDLPPARELDGPPTANWIDEVVLVIEAERTRIQAAQRAKDSLQRAGVRVAGVVLANRREHIPRWLYQRL